MHSKNRLIATLEEIPETDQKWLGSGFYNARRTQILKLLTAL